MSDINVFSTHKKCRKSCGWFFYFIEKDRPDEIITVGDYLECHHGNNWVVIRQNGPNDFMTRRSFPSEDRKAEASGLQPGIIAS